MKRTARLGSGWIGGVASPLEVKTVIEGIKEEATKVGRSIDSDHYGASLAFRIGTPEDDAIKNNAFVKRTGIGEDLDLNPLICVGSSKDLIERINEYLEVGATKFVLFPLVSDFKDMANQTKLIVEEVKPLIEN